MIILPPDFKEFVLLLKKHEAEFMIVGGYALAFHGKPRFTGDIDIWIHRTETNIEKVLQALTDFGFSSLDLSINDFTEESVIQLGYPPLRIDILTSLSGITWETSFPNSVCDTIDGVKIPFIDKQSLIRNKQSVGRTQDKADVEGLKE